MDLRPALVALHVLGCAFTLHWCRHMPFGWKRAPLALCCVIGNLLAPLLFDRDRELISFVLLGLNLLWLGSFKVLGWAVGRGPLCASLTLPQLVAVVGLPITPVLKVTSLAKGNARQGEIGHAGPLAATLSIATKFAVLLVVLVALPQKSLPRLGQELLYALGLYLFIGLFFDGIGALSALLLDMPLAPNFDKPFLSTSLTDFWSRRWNLSTGYTVRFLVYDPVVEGRLVKGKRRPGRPPKASPARLAAAVCTAFAVSGLMHELFIVYLRGRVSGYWAAFFSVQGPLVVGEAAARQWLRDRGVSVPRWVAVPLTLSTLLLVGDWLFFPDILRMHLPQDVFIHMYAMLPSAIQALAPDALAVMS